MFFLKIQAVCTRCAILLLLWNLLPGCSFLASKQTSGASSTKQIQPQGSEGQSSGTTIATVVKVRDGDTLEAKTATGAIVVRMACIDAPELEQKPYGVNAKKRLQELLPIGDSIELSIVDVDKYKRQVAEVFWHDNNANLQMVKEGQAAVYPDFLANCSENRAKYLEAEKLAKRQRVAFWEKEVQTSPWDYRNGIRPMKLKPEEDTKINSLAKIEAPQTEAPVSALDFLEDYLNYITTKGGTGSGTGYFCQEAEELASSLFAPTAADILDINEYPDNEGVESANAVVRIDSSNKGGTPIRTDWRFYMKKGPGLIEGLPGGWCLVLIDEK